MSENIENIENKENNYIDIGGIEYYELKEIKNILIPKKLNEIELNLNDNKVNDNKVNTEKIILTPINYYLIYQENSPTYVPVIEFELKYINNNEIIKSIIPYYLSDGHTNLLNANMIYPFVCFSLNNDDNCPNFNKKIRLSDGGQIKLNIVKNLNLNDMKLYLLKKTIKDYYNLLINKKNIDYIKSIEDNKKNIDEIYIYFYYNLNNFISTNEDKDIVFFYNELKILIGQKIKLYKNKINNDKNISDLIKNNNSKIKMYIYELKFLLNIIKGSSSDLTSILQRIENIMDFNISLSIAKIANKNNTIPNNLDISQKYYIDNINENESNNYSTINKIFRFHLKFLLESEKLNIIKYGLIKYNEINIEPIKILKNEFNKKYNICNEKNINNKNFENYKIIAYKFRDIIKNKIKEELKNNLNDKYLNTINNLIIENDSNSNNDNHIDKIKEIWANCKNDFNKQNNLNNQEKKENNELEQENLNQKKRKLDNNKDKDIDNNKDIDIKLLLSGGYYYNKYIKYKTKYINLKKKV